jgi:hypothetical protein
VADEGQRIDMTKENLEIVEPRIYREICSFAKPDKGKWPLRYKELSRRGQIPNLVD